MSSSHLLSLDFESKQHNYSVETVDFPSYMDPTFDAYLQYPPASPNFGTGLGCKSSCLSILNSELTFVSVAQAGASPMFAPMNLTGSMGGYTYTSAPSPDRPYTPPDSASIPPALTYDLSGAELLSEGPSSGRTSRVSGRSSPSVAVSSPSVAPAASLPRSARFNPLSAAASTRPILKHKKRASASKAAQAAAAALSDDEDEDEDFHVPAMASNEARRECIRKQRIESEQRRRDELRDGYTRLKENLPSTTQKTSKVSILDRAVSHIRYLDAVRIQLEKRLHLADNEVHRLRNVNEALMLGAASQRAQSSTALVGAF